MIRFWVADSATQRSVVVKGIKLWMRMRRQANLSDWLNK